jgi:hypothetical protein
MLLRVSKPTVMKPRVDLYSLFLASIIGVCSPTSTILGEALPILKFSMQGRAAIGPTTFDLPHNFLGRGARQGISDDAS